MSELLVKQEPKVQYVDKTYNSLREERLRKDEEEIKKLEEGLTEVDAEEEAPKEEEANTEVKEEALSPEERTFKKRYGDLRRHMSQKEKEWEDRLKSLESIKKGDIKAPKTSQEISKWVEENSEIASYIRGLAATQAEVMFRDAKINLDQINEERESIKRQSAESKISTAHPDFHDLRQSDEFHNWAEEQPKWVQDALYENIDDAASVIRVIDLYKMDNGLTPKDKKSKTKDAAKSVTRKQAPSVSVDDRSGKILESEIAKMSMREYEDREEEINKAMKNGDIIYDLSK